MRSMPEKAHIAASGPLRVILVRAQSEKSRERLHLLREYPGHPEQSVGRNTDDKAHSEKVSNRNEEHVTGNWRKGDLSIKGQRTWFNCVCVLVFC